MKKIIFLLLLLISILGVSAQEKHDGSTVSGFRICVYNGTEQNARNLANGAISTVRGSISSSIAVKMAYDAPVFKVLVGACLNRTEATILLSRIRKVFPNAFIVTEKFKVEELLGTPSMMDNNIETEVETDVQEETI